MSENDETRANLRGRVCLVTGAAGGIGRAVAQLFARSGAQVVLADRDVDGAASVAATYPGSTMVVPLDVSDPTSWDRAVDAAVDALGPPTVLANIAGIAPPDDGDFEALTV